MRKIFLLILTMISVNVFANEMESKVTVQQNGSEYTVRYFNYSTAVEKYFSKLGLQGSGYTWEALVKAGVTSESPELLDKLEFAPEGSTFVAYTSNEPAANKVKTILENLSSDTGYRSKLVKIATDGGYIE